jgi:hypothetical protein
MSKKSSTFAVDFQRVHNHKLLSRMKTFIHCIILAVVLCLAVACDPDGPLVDPGPPTEFVVEDIPSDELPYFLADTVTPPSNPMAPEDLTKYPTFVGILQMFPLDGIKGLYGKYFCGIELLSPICGPEIGGETYCSDKLYLLGRSEQLLRFDHPQLASCIVGDTIFVTGVPKVITYGHALGLKMLYVQPQ